MRKPLTLTLIAVTGALIAACGGSAHSDRDPGAAAQAPAAKTATVVKAPASAAKTATAAEAPARHAAAAPLVVKLQNSSFLPANLHVKAGQTIRFVNDDPIAHTVTATKGGKFDSGTLDAGGSFDVKVAKRGTISYVCLIHPGMDGTITVD